MFSKTSTIAGALLVATLFTGCDEVFLETERTYYEPAYYPSTTHVYVYEEHHRHKYDHKKKKKKKHYDDRRHHRPPPPPPHYRRGDRPTEIVIIEKDKHKKKDRKDKKDKDKKKKKH